MVKIRLRRTGARNRPFYRVVVAKSTSARNGAFIENLGTYNPVVKPTHVKIDADRALFWLMRGAQPTETAAYLLNKVGVLDKFFAQRPHAKKHYAFLDKRTAATSVKSVVDSSEAPRAEAAPPEELARRQATDEPGSAPEDRREDAEVGVEATEPSAASEELQSDIPAVEAEASDGAEPTEPEEAAS